MNSRGCKPTVTNKTQFDPAGVAHAIATLDHSWRLLSYAWSRRNHVSAAMAHATSALPHACFHPADAWRISPDPSSASPDASSTLADATYEVANATFSRLVAPFTMPIAPIAQALIRYGVSGARIASILAALSPTLDSLLRPVAAFRARRGNYGGFFAVWRCIRGLARFRLIDEVQPLVPSAASELFCWNFGAGSFGWSVMETHKPTGARHTGPG